MEIVPQLKPEDLKLIKPIKSAFINELGDLMQNKQFRTFFDKHSNDWHDLQTVIMYVLLYKTLEEKYKKMYNKDINPEYIKLLVQQFFINPKSRQIIVKQFLDFTKSIKN